MNARASRRENQETLARGPKIAPNRNAPHPFDLKYGTDTGGYLSPDELHGGTASDAMNNGYSAVAPSVFREACRRWRETLPSSSARVEAYTFVDVGAGKGRALLLAAELPFRKVIGVELNEDLARIAQRNITLWMNWSHAFAAKIRVLQQDALEFRWPRPPLLVYLNNPFECESGGATGGQNWRRAAPAPAWWISSTSIPAARTPDQFRKFQIVVERANSNGRSRPAGRPLRRGLGSRRGIPIRRIAGNALTIPSRGQLLGGITPEISGIAACGNDPDDREACSLGGLACACCLMQTLFVSSMSWRRFHHSSSLISLPSGLEK